MSPALGLPRSERGMTLALRRASGSTPMERARARVLVLLCIMAEPGASRTRLMEATSLSDSTVRSILRELRKERLVVTTIQGPFTASYAVPQPDPAAAARLQELTTGHKTTVAPSRADINGAVA